MYVTWWQYTVKCTLQISTHKHSSIIWSVWLNGWVFVCKLRGCGFESHCSLLKLQTCACLEQGDPWYLGNYMCGFTLKRIHDIRGWLRPKLTMIKFVWAPQIWASKLIKVIKKDSKTNTNSPLFSFNVLQ